MGKPGRPARPIPPGTRWCSYHQGAEPLGDFSGTERTCRTGKTLRHVLLAYGVTPEQYAAMRLKPCPICQVRAVQYVDHDHSCCPGKKSCGRCVREMLCSRCNTALDSFGEDPAVLMRAIEYLSRHQAGIARRA